MDPLLDLLKHNARASLEDLAKALATTPEAIAARIDALETKGVIIGYQTILDAEKAGSQAVEAIIEVKVTPERGGGFDRLASRLAQFEEVQSCYLMSGGYDLLLIVQSSDLQAVARFVAERLSTIKGVNSTATRFRLKSYKENGMLIGKEKKPQRLAVSP
jgi:DNA-binding Lrp family transcriptional regulator